MKRAPSNFWLDCQKSYYFKCWCCWRISASCSIYKIVLNSETDIDTAYNNIIKIKIPQGFARFIEMFNTLIRKLQLVQKYRRPWGGGNLFAINLSNFLIKNGHEVVYDLHDNILILFY